MNSRPKAQVLPYCQNYPKYTLAVEFAVPPALALALVAGLSLGPSLLNWRVTGEHRLVPGSSLQQRCIKVG
jgi:hypothetical protein